MRRLTRISDQIDRLLGAVARVAGWAGVGLIAVTLFDVVTRRFLVLGSTKLQEFEWHLHTVLFGLLIGYAYIKDAHVRIDLIRERLGERTRWWIELIGCCLFLLPYCALVVYYSYDFTLRSFLNNEVSASATGLSHRWIIKSVIPFGFALLALAGVAVALRKVVELFGPPDPRRRVHHVEDAGGDHVFDIRTQPNGER